MANDTCVSVALLGLDINRKKSFQRWKEICFKCTF